MYWSDPVCQSTESFWAFQRRAPTPAVETLLFLVCCYSPKCSQMPLFQSVSEVSFDLKTRHLALNEVFGNKMQNIFGADRSNLVSPFMVDWSLLQFTPEIDYVTCCAECLFIFVLKTLDSYTFWPFIAAAFLNKYWIAIYQLACASLLLSKRFSFNICSCIKWFWAMYAVLFIILCGGLWRPLLCPGLILEKVFPWLCIFCSV